MVVIAAPGGAFFRRDAVGGGRLDVDREQAQAAKGVAQPRRAGEHDPLIPFLVEPFRQQSDHGADRARKRAGKMADLDDEAALDPSAGARRDRLFYRRVEVLLEKQLAAGRAQAERAAQVAVRVAHAEQARHEGLDARAEALCKTLADEGFGDGTVASDMLEQVEERPPGG